MNSYCDDDVRSHGLWVRRSLMVGVGLNIFYHLRAINRY